MGMFQRRKISVRARQRELRAMIFQEFLEIRKSLNERALRSMLIVQLPTGLWKLALTDSKN